LAVVVAESGAPPEPIDAVFEDVAEKPLKKTGSALVLIGGKAKP
jgi:hypothetical protein